MNHINCIALILSLSFTMIFFIFKKNKNYIVYEKNNMILLDILKIAYTSKFVDEAGLKILNILNKYYIFDNITLFKYDEYKDRLNIISTNIIFKDIADSKELINMVHNFINKSTDAYIESSNMPLKYKSTLQRDIKYLYFIPLKTNNRVIGALLIENVNLYNKNLSKDYESEFFKVITNTIALALQNLIYFDKITSSSYTDGLTEVYNRHYLNIFISEKVHTYYKNNIPFTIVLFDIDYFKKINDTYGHNFGDEVLKEVAKFVSKNIRDDDIIIRYGGEEFLLFLPNITKETAFLRIDNIRDRISQLIIIDNKGTAARVTVSFGLASYPDDSSDINDLIEKADKALYHSKYTGRNKTTAYNNNLTVSNI